MLATRFTLMFPGAVDKLILENPIGLEDWKVHAPYTTIDENYQKELEANYESTRKYQLEFYYDTQWKAAVLYELENIRVPTLLIIGTRDRTPLLTFLNTD